MDIEIIPILKNIDIDRIVEIYNSNKTFLESHLGVSRISKEFILNELEEMKIRGFTSSIIKNSKGEIVGICDFKIADEVYLSLLMIDSKLKGNRLGSFIYNKLEEVFKSKNSNSIRIDVVYNYEENVLDFWQKLGFISCENIDLEWNGYKSKAIKMYKNLYK